MPSLASGPSSVALSWTASTRPASIHPRCACDCEYCGLRARTPLGPGRDWTRRIVYYCYWSAGCSSWNSAWLGARASSSSSPRLCIGGSVRRDCRRLDGQNRRAAVSGIFRNGLAPMCRLGLRCPLSFLFHPICRSGSWRSWFASVKGRARSADERTCCHLPPRRE
ncbi:hypothetical protein Mapa_002998 [Marchantia paleacea]|nr:hypothetical protein Mapa_002998 [Marchantia paleacea]